MSLFAAFRVSKVHANSSNIQMSGTYDQYMTKPSGTGHNSVIALQLECENYGYLVGQVSTDDTGSR